jgi:hypothetical protein
MKNKIKVPCLIIGLMVCLLIVFTTKAKVIQEDNTESKIDHAVVTQLGINTRTQWIIKTTYKFLQNN